MKRIVLILLALLSFAAVYSQSVDERIGNAINRGEWRELRSLYKDEGTSLQTPILHPLSNFFISHFYNQSDSALYYGAKLLNEHQASLGASVGSVIYLMANDFAKKGEYENAAGILKQYNDALKAGGVRPDSIFIAFENQYHAIARQGGFSMLRPEHDVRIPIKYQKNRKEPGMMFVEAQLNSHTCDVTYDTGAGINMISKQLAKKLCLHIHDFEGTAIDGVGTAGSAFAILDSLRIGDIIYKNVPFQVVDFSTGHQLADSVINEIGLQCVIGLQTMFPLQEIQFDFKNGYLNVPHTQSAVPDYAPNIYISGENVLIMSVFDKKSNKTIDALIDTGASTSHLTSRYYAANRNLFVGITPNDSIRMAGIGGVEIVKAISTTWEYRVGDGHYMNEPILVSTDENVGFVSKYDCLLGLPSLAQYDCVTINFKDMWVRLSSETVK